MIQAVPFHQSLLIRREYSESEDPEYEYYIEDFEPFVPFDTNSSSTEFFDSWWSTYINNRDEAAIDVMPLSLSVMQQVAAPWSSGIEGNSQSAGTFGRNMRRKYKGESIPSQSLTQQDEPVQQKNSHEAGELIPMRTLRKKVKTYSRKMLSPGTTSTISSTSAFPSSSTPAIEEPIAGADTPQRFHTFIIFAED